MCPATVDISEPLSDIHIDITLTCLGPEAVRPPKCFGAACPRSWSRPPLTSSSNHRTGAKRLRALVYTLRVCHLFFRWFVWFADISLRSSWSSRSEGIGLINLQEDPLSFLMRGDWMAILGCRTTLLSNQQDLRVNFVHSLWRSDSLLYLRAAVIQLNWISILEIYTFHSVFQWCSVSKEI